MPLRIAVVGSGISGSLCARLLATRHEATLFEAADRIGGHTHTIDVEVFDKFWPVDTGFMVFNDRTYPKLIRMLELLEIDSRPSDMSFSVSCQRSGLEYQGSSLNGLFAQRRNLVRPSFYRMLGDILRFNRQATALLDAAQNEVALGEFLQQHRYCEQFADHYLLPMIAAIWSAPPQAMRRFPVKLLARFLQNHGLLQVYDRPQWRTIVGGAGRYLDALLQPLGDAVRTASPVTAIRRNGSGVLITGCAGQLEEFDAVVLACHAPQALALRADASALEQEVLSTFDYQPNEAVLHVDEAMLPRRKRAWASWNYRTSDATNQPATVTYDLSRLQGHASPSPILQTLNPTEPIAPAKVLQRLQFEHPLFNFQTQLAQQQHERLHKDGKVYYCGAYWGYGFHEDGVESALRVCRHFDISLENLKLPCIAASTKVGSNTRAKHQ
ncbi:MAG: NAD(P)/FAD-dependent oxidoreductase [Bythopirellula sp.]